MRKLMWFAVGFTLAALIGMYGLWGSAYFPAAGVAALVLAVCIWLHQRKGKLRIAVAIALGCTVGFGWMFLFDSAYLSAPRQVDETYISMTITATDYGEETDYGIRVEGMGKLNGKIYQMQVYLPAGMDISPGDSMTGRFLLRATLPGCSAESKYQTAENIFLTAKISRKPTIVVAQELPWYGYAAMIRQSVRQVLSDCMPEDAAGFSVALLIGDRQ